MPNLKLVITVRDRLNGKLIIQEQEFSGANKLRRALAVAEIMLKSLVKREKFELLNLTITALY